LAQRNAILGSHQLHPQEKLCWAQVNRIKSSAHSRTHSGDKTARPHDEVINPDQDINGALGAEALDEEPRIGATWHQTCLAEDRLELRVPRPQGLFEAIEGLLEATSSSLWADHVADHVGLSGGCIQIVSSSSPWRKAVFTSIW
jgi:hypothetical protein